MASNLVVARGGVEFVPPISLAFWRWTVVFLILLPFTYITLKKNNIRKTIVHLQNAKDIGGTYSTPPLATTRLLAIKIG